MTMTKRRRRGFTIIEAVLAMVIISGSFMGLSYVLSNTTVQNIDIEISSKAVFLARGKMAEMKAKDFASLTSVPSTSFGGNFADYRFTVTVGYVNQADLNTIVAGPTNFKRIQVSVTYSGRPINITITSLKANI